MENKLLGPEYARIDEEDLEEKRCLGRRPDRSRRPTDIYM